MKKFMLFLAFTLILNLSFFNQKIFAAEDLETFSPYLGESNISSNSNGRYSLQYMYWRTGSLTEFTSYNDTYEHETIFYNYDGSAYATKGNSYQSNLPDTYIDTQALDSGNEYNIAVGTFDPHDLKASTWYNYTISLDSTNSSSSFYKISGQEGYSGCETGAWCVQNGTTSHLIPFKSPFKAPETGRDFKFEWENNGSMNSAADYISLYDWGSGVIKSSSDVDYWDFDVSVSRTTNFKAKIPSGVDYDINVYNDSGTIVAKGRRGTGEDETFSAFLPAGHYYIKVYSYSGSSRYNSYSLIPY